MGRGMMGGDGEEDDRRGDDGGGGDVREEMPGTHPRSLLPRPDAWREPRESPPTLLPREHKRAPYKPDTDLPQPQGLF